MVLIGKGGNPGGRGPRAKPSHDEEDGILFGNPAALGNSLVEEAPSALFCSFFCSRQKHDLCGRGRRLAKVDKSFRRMEKALSKKKSPLLVCPGLHYNSKQTRFHEDCLTGRTCFHWKYNLIKALLDEYVSVRERNFSTNFISPEGSLK